MTTIEGDVGNSFSGGNVAGDVNQFFMKIVRDALEARSLDPQTVRRLQQIHLPTEQSVAARTALTAGAAVALVGEPGSGRWTTGIAAIADLGGQPHHVVLDDDLRRSLEVQPGHGYLLDLEESRDNLGLAAGPWVGDLAGRIRESGCHLVVRAHPHDWYELAIDEHAVPAVTMKPPPPAAVLHSHLTMLTSASIAAEWAQQEAITERLEGARPADAVRLARIIGEFHNTGVPVTEQLEAVMAAYANWADQLSQWFHSTRDPSHGPRRAMLLAAAALEGTPAATVCAAADHLAEMVHLPPTPGGALVGADIESLVSEAEAELRDGRVCFTRPSYAESVLDHVWRKRPNLQPVLRNWLTALPDPGDQHTAQAAQTLTSLAIRHGDASMITSAVVTWATKSPGLRPLAVAALTAAAISDQLGGRVRRRMYQWSTTATIPEELHMAIVEVCAGPLARAYPQIVLTRLRHLTIRHSERVRQASVEALASLAQDHQLRGPVLRDLADWVSGEDPRREMGLRAFLRLTELREGERITILPSEMGAGIDVLAQLWRAVLRQSEYAGTNSVVSWLEAAGQGHASRKAVIEVFARTCNSSLDLGYLTKAVLDWVEATGASDDRFSRKEIAMEILHHARQRDRLSTMTIPHGEEEG